ncbi:MAG: polysaccharide deacetylase family protein [Spirochaetes bacterium]|nr:polysaccharide deacetylase family protein [Spirochaetota bacterium]
MCNFYKILIATAVLVVILLLVKIYFQLNSAIYGIYFILVTFFLIFIHAVFSPGSNLFVRTIKGREFFKTGRGNGSILLKFDDGPDPNYTPKILDILKKDNMQAIFFVTGKRAEKYPEILKRAVSENHLIGNHSYSHSYLINFFRYKRLLEEVTKTSNIIEKITGIKPEYYCPPMGQKNPVLGKVIRQTRLDVLTWDIKSYDTLFSTDRIIKRVKSKLRKNTIILFHDGIFKNTKKDRHSTVEALPAVIRLIKQNYSDVVKQ